MSSKPRLCFVTGAVGAPSERWLWRQVVGFRLLRPHVLAWAYIDREPNDLAGITVDTVPFDMRPQDQPGLARWIFRLKNLKGLNFYGTVGPERRFLRDKVLENKPDVMLCQFGQMALRMLPVAMELKIPLVAHFHGLDLSSSLRNRWYRWSLLRYLPYFDQVVVVGSHQRQWLLEHGVNCEHVHLIPCGVPTKDLPCKKHEPREEIKFLAVSRLVEKKGVEYTIKAFAKVAYEYKRATLTIIGDGPLRLPLERLTRELGISEKVTFMGFLSFDAVRDYLVESDIFVQHSIVSNRGEMEGSPVAIGEAQACGLPVVVTRRCGGTEELILDGKSGFLVNQRDVAMMAHRMLRLAKDVDLRARMGITGREYMIRNFDTDKQVQKLEEVLLVCCQK